MVVTNHFDMFLCYHCGGCCEDVCTQINLTLGDIKRLSEKTGKSALKLYKEGVIGVFPFGDPFKDDEYETDVGLFIPCRFRKSGKCSIYGCRPINCRLFPYWILAEAPLNEIKTLICPGHECMKHLEIDADFKEDRKEYHSYKEKLVQILHFETQLSDKFYKKIGLKKKIKAKPSKTKDDDLKIIFMLVKKLCKKDFSELFRKIDKEVKKQDFTPSGKMPKLNLR
jgi:Fe-S-cluster containining protein